MSLRRPGKRPCLIGPCGSLTKAKIVDVCIWHDFPSACIEFYNSEISNADHADFYDVNAAWVDTDILIYMGHSVPVEVLQGSDLSNYLPISTHNWSIIWLHTWGSNCFKLFITYIMLCILFRYRVYLSFNLSFFSGL